MLAAAMLHLLHISSLHRQMLYNNNLEVLVLHYLYPMRIYKDTEQLGAKNPQVSEMWVTR